MYVADLYERDKISNLRSDVRNHDKDIVWKPDVDTEGRATPKIRMFSELSSRYPGTLVLK